MHAHRLASILARTQRRLTAGKGDQKTRTARSQTCTTKGCGGQYDRACQEQIEQRAQYLQANSILNLLSLLSWSEINLASPVGQKDT
jgi:hypothetical protein